LSEIGKEEQIMALLKEGKVAKRYDVDKRTLARWDKKPELGFPGVVYVNGQRYRDEDKLDEFDAARVRASMLERHNERRLAHAKSASEAASKARQLKRQLAAQPATESV
jgi:hypothetical protein